MSEDPNEYFHIVLTEIDKAWLKQIFVAMTSQTMTDDTIQLAMELAFKRGHAVGRKSSGR